MTTRMGMVDLADERVSARAAPRPRWLAFTTAGSIALALALAASWALQRQLGLFQAALDSRALGQAAAVFDLAVEQQRAQVASQVAVLSADTRVRAPLVAPRFDEATVRDVLVDLKAMSGATLLAVMDTAGKVRAVAGVPALRDLDLGSSPLVKTARQRPGADVWSLPDRALVVGVAPVQSADQTEALLAMGFEISPALLAGIQRAVGVDGALMIGERVAASSSADPVLLQAFQRAAGLSDQREQLLPGDRPLVARVTRTGPSAAAAKMVWLVPYRHETERAGFLAPMTWLPAVLVAATFALLFSLARRAAPGVQLASGRQRG